MGLKLEAQRICWKAQICLLAFHNYYACEALPLQWATAVMHNWMSPLPHRNDCVDGCKLHKQANNRCEFKYCDALASGVVWCTKVSHKDLDGLDTELLPPLPLDPGV
jgi:hypothetical protein